MNPTCDDRNPSVAHVLCVLPAGHPGSHHNKFTRRAWSNHEDYAEGGVTAAQIEKEVLTADETRSLVQERDAALAYAAEAIAAAQAEATAAVTAKEEAEHGRERLSSAFDRQARTIRQLTEELDRSRPVTVTEDALDRAQEAWEMSSCAEDVRTTLRRCIDAALTEPPARSEAEALEADLRTAEEPVMDDEDRRLIADHLATLGWTKGEA